MMSGSSISDDDGKSDGTLVQVNPPADMLG